MTTEPLRCSDCGSTAVIAVRPGREHERMGARKDGFVLYRGEPDRIWCPACWPALKPVTEEAQP
jgi:hypothetical protein